MFGVFNYHIRFFNRKEKQLFLTEILYKCWGNNRIINKVP